MKCSIAAFALLLPMAAQQPVSPSTEPVGRARGEDFGNYNLVQSYELGVRFHDVGGSEAKYRSDVNFGNGLRLLGSRFSLNSKDGHGRLFDELSVWTQGLGNDPYQSAGLRAGKNRWWRYDLLWRSNAYFNPGLAIAAGQHAIDTERRLQDHDLTLLPQSRVKFFLGYSGAAQSGPALSTVTLFDIRDDEYPLFTSVDRRQREFRLGNEFKVLGVRFNWVHSWERYEENSPHRIESPQQGNNAADRATLSRLNRTEPYTGSTPGWRVNILREGRSFWAVNGRFTHSAGRRRFAFDESAAGTDRSGSARARQVLVTGDALRPITTGHLTLSIFPSERLSITNHSGFHNTRMEGNSSYLELSNGSLVFDRLDFQFLGIRNFTNSTDASFRAARRLQFHGGHQYSTRTIRSVEQQGFSSFTDRFETSQQNRVHSGMFGLRLQPVTGMTMAFDGELGRQDRPFFPTADKDYHGLSARAVYRKRNVWLSATAKSAYNFNGAGFSVHSARARTYSLDASWQARGWLAIESGYSKLHSDTASWLAYFASGGSVTGARSFWVSNIHAVNLAGNLALGNRINLSLGLSRTEDMGGDSPAAASPASVFAPAQQFPMLFQSPSGRLSVRLTEKLRWNAAYQYYGYRENLLPALNYRAHTGFTSLLWTF